MKFWAFWSKNALVAQALALCGQLAVLAFWVLTSDSEVRYSQFFINTILIHCFFLGLVSVLFLIRRNACRRYVLDRVSKFTRLYPDHLKSVTFDVTKYELTVEPNNDKPREEARRLCELLVAYVFWAEYLFDGKGSLYFHYSVGDEVGASTMTARTVSDVARRAVIMWPEYHQQVENYVEFGK